MKRCRRDDHPPNGVPCHRRGLRFAPPENRFTPFFPRPQHGDMSALSLLLAVVSGILAVVALSRISALTGEVSFLRSLLHQAIDRIRHLENSSDVETRASSLKVATPATSEPRLVPGPADQIPALAAVPPPLPVDSTATQSHLLPEIPFERPDPLVAPRERIGSLDRSQVDSSWNNSSEPSCLPGSGGWPSSSRRPWG